MKTNENRTNAVNVASGLLGSVVQISNLFGGQMPWKAYNDIRRSLRDNLIAQTGFTKDKLDSDFAYCVINYVRPYEKKGVTGFGLFSGDNTKALRNYIFSCYEPAVALYSQQLGRTIQPARLNPDGTSISLPGQGNVNMQGMEGYSGGQYSGGFGVPTMAGFGGGGNNTIIYIILAVIFIGLMIYFVKGK